MKRAIVLIIALVAAALAYRQYGSAGPVKTYEAFAEEMLRRNYDAAAAMTDGLTPAQLGKLGSQERIGFGPAMFQKLFPSRFRIDSEEKAADGSITISAVQTVLFNPVGVESVMRPAMYADLRQVTTLRKTGGGWKVTSFKNEFSKMDEVRHP